MTLRKRAGRSLQKVGASLLGDRWRHDLYSGCLLRDGGVRFTTTAALMEFCRDVFGGAVVEVMAGSDTVTDTPEVVVARLAELPEHSRRSITVRRPAKVEDPRFVEFTNQGKGNSIVKIGGYGDRDESDYVASVVDRHTQPLSRSQRRRAVPVLVPMTSREAHQEDLKVALSRRSAMWGGAAGLVASVAVALIDRLVG